jgi:TRAP-type mannitol/chloroaromatic compound transport system substrate-binding protein
MKGIIQELDELNDEQIDVLMNKLSNLKKTQIKKIEQETKTAHDMLTNEQKIIIKNIEKITKDDLLETAEHYDDDNVKGFIARGVSYDVNEFVCRIKDDIKYSEDVVKDIKNIIKAKNKELKEEVKNTKIFKKRISEATEVKKLLGKLKKTIKTK